MIPAGVKALGVLSVLAGGTALGAVLSTFVDPVPRQPDPAPAQLSGRPEFGGAQAYRLVEVGPEDLSPPHSPDGYAPGWADDNVDVWQYPEPELAAWEPLPYPSVAELDAQIAADAALLDSGAERAPTAASETVDAPAKSGSAPTESPEPTRHESRLAGLY